VAVKAYLFLAGLFCAKGTFMNCESSMRPYDDPICGGTRLSKKKSSHSARSSKDARARAADLRDTSAHALRAGNRLSASRIEP
jgi:hypothetical protein